MFLKSILIFFQHSQGCTLWKMLQQKEIKSRIYSIIHMGVKSPLKFRKKAILDNILKSWLVTLVHKLVHVCRCVYLVPPGDQPWLCWVSDTPGQLSPAPSGSLSASAPSPSPSSGGSGKRPAAARLNPGTPAAYMVHWLRVALMLNEYILANSQGQRFDSTGAFHDKKICTNGSFKTIWIKDTAYTYFSCYNAYIQEEHYIITILHETTFV